MKRKHIKEQIDQQRDVANASWDTLKQNTEKTVNAEVAERMKIWAPGRAAVKGEVELILDNSVLVTDKRRITPQRAEAVFQAEQELLRAPLNPTEQRQTIKRLAARVNLDKEAAKEQVRKDKNADSVRANDFEGDSRALSRLQQLVNGEAIGRGDDSHNQRIGMNITERLDDLVKNYAALAPENYEDDGSRRLIGSMGGTVEIGDKGQVHFSGYNNGLLYEFARARQIWNTLETNPYMIRQDVLGVTTPQELDMSWVSEQPVLVTAEDTARRQVRL